MLSPPQKRWPALCIGKVWRKQHIDGMKDQGGIGLAFNPERSKPAD